MRRFPLVVVCSALFAGCGSCGSSSSTTSDAAAPDASNTVVAEALPRCRADGTANKLLLPSEDAIVGDVAIGPNELLVGLIRTNGGARIASVLSVKLDLTHTTTIDVGTAYGDDPPPSPRWNGSEPWVAFIAKQPNDGGVRLRALKVAKLEKVGKEASTIIQQADESTAFDVAWGENGSALAAWDEDAPFKEVEAGAPATSHQTPGPQTLERGFVKVQLLAEGSPRRVASPETSDAEAPRLIARPGGYWLGWLARKVEEDAYSVEGPGEKRALRWVEVVPLDLKGDPAGPVRKVSSEKGRAISFELARGKDPKELVVMVQDEVAASEGGGTRILRHVIVDPKQTEKTTGSDLIDGGAGTALVELVPVSPAASEGARWLAWTDQAEHTHLTPLGPGLVTVAHASLEPSLDGARVLASTAPDQVYALAGMENTQSGLRSQPELRRFLCK